MEAVGVAEGRIENVQGKGELELHTEAGRQGSGFPEPPEAAK